MRHKYHYTYKIIRADGKYYIGVHSTNDLEDGYLGSGKVMKRSLKKYGPESHHKQIIAFHISRQQALHQEAELVTEETLLDPRCMNIIRGGGGTYDTSKISASLKGKQQPKSVCEAISKRRKGVPTWGRAVFIEGVTYKSAAEAARALGISDRTITSRCRRMSTPNWRYADEQNVVKPTKKHPKAKSVIVDGILYGRVADVEEKYGVCRRTIRHRCLSPDFPNWQYVTPGID